jgi:cellulose synthase/poly-beta-1,6-N-acetylglucosamine synthase-like glycosyltransferase
MTITEILFWVSTTLFLHTWFGYPLLLFVLAKVSTRRSGLLDDRKIDRISLPTVAVIIASYNAGKIISRKIINTLELNYPADKLEIVVVSDGSTDDTVERARAVPAVNVAVFALKDNQGKSAAQNFGVKHAKNDILVFTDVDATLDKEFLINLMPSFSDPEVSCAGGAALLRMEDGQMSKSQGIYWRMEQFLKSAESRFKMLHSLPGWGFAMRRSDFIFLDPDTGDDMILPLEMALQGKRSVIAQNAWVSDNMPSSFQGELKARARITLRNLTGLMRRKQLLMPWLFPRMSFALWSHKLLRWLSPFLMLSILMCTSILHFFKMHDFFSYILYLQLVLYVFGSIGVLAVRKGFTLPFAGHIAAFLIANFGFMLGVLKYISGHKVSSYKNIK